MKNKELREWINTFIEILILIVMIFGLVQINNLNINLEKVTAISGEFRNINATNASLNYIEMGDAKLYWNGSCYIIQVNSTREEICS